MLLQLRACLDELLILIRLAKEVKAFNSFKAFQYVVEQVVSVYRQNEGWLRSTAKQGYPEGKQGQRTSTNTCGSDNLPSTETMRKARAILRDALLI